MKNVIYFLLLATLVSCSKNDDPAPEECGLFPLTLGNTWSYNTTNYDSTGTVTGTKTSTVTLKTNSTYNGIVYFNIDSVDYPLRNKDCNTLGFYNPINSTEIPVSSTYSQNDTVINDFPYSATNRGIRIIGNKDRTTIDGHDCYKLEFQFTSFRGVYYRKRLYFINEKIGMVKSQGYDIRTNREYLSDQQELKSYTLK